MSNYIFLFDLDSTITKAEILPTIAKKVNKEKEMCELTEKTMQGEIPFKESFIERVNILKDIPINEVQNIIENIPLNDKLVEFISKNKERCYIVTGNLDIWISKLIHKLGMENNLFCSKACESDNKLLSIISVIDKEQVCNQFITSFVAVGDGNNDALMIQKADYGIGYGGVRDIAPSVLECASHAIYDEEILCKFLEKLL